MSAFAASDDPDVLDYSYAEPDPTTTTPPIGPPEQSMSTPETTHSRSRSNNPLLGGDNPLVSELEQEVLDEYSRLLRNVNQLSEKIGDLAGSPASMTLDGLRLLERKTATVCTLLKASVYSIVLQQQIWNESEEQEKQQQQQQGEEQEGQFQDQEYQHGGGYDREGDETFQ
ncbi:DASH complexsubunit Dad3 [Penicillium daleae]|uniref:DASH complex subunit DAD3 n=1 Tax=Penicillium daleae TaxID=63821 RepID=A0AAD6BUI2_9EURO|nr:DASH complexsubunit Dad3 [Penicillium daleae]KAJ5433162.1 DASH complexsubunit Dad3 [Penicillium daleae]